MKWHPMEDDITLDGWRALDGQLGLEVPKGRIWLGGFEVSERRIGVMRLFGWADKVRLR